MTRTSRHLVFLTRTPLISESSGVSKDFINVRIQLRIQNNTRSCRFCGESVGTCLSVVRPVLRLSYEYVQTDLAIVNHERMTRTSRHPAFLTRKPLRSESSGVSKDLIKVRIQF
ncbi:hypothetical protein AVEN_142620-1 [Araneus ventricosus]|uniref:Uncharacterized protein n=1 Tax=Araneus ventricosus TaxID=182803 RepID=A0A4Y2GBX5_ARAVE|nr:hypothetical protein AVEN_142620-1 [Araneus ventricosus]